MITERSIRADMAEEDFTDEQIDEAVEDYWDAKIDQYIGDREFEEAHPW